MADYAAMKKNEVLAFSNMHGLWGYQSRGVHLLQGSVSLNAQKGDSREKGG